MINPFPTVGHINFNKSKEVSHKVSLLLRVQQHPHLSLGCLQGHRFRNGQKKSKLHQMDNQTAPHIKHADGLCAGGSLLSQVQSNSSDPLYRPLGGTR